MGGMDGEVVGPAAVALVADHDAPDQLVVAFEYENVRRIMRELALDVVVRVVPWSGQPAGHPECHEPVAVEGRNGLRRSIPSV